MLPTALEISREGFQNNDRTTDNPDVLRIYYCRLLSAILREFCESGRCEYVEMLEKDSEVKQIDWHVLELLNAIFTYPLVPCGQNNKTDRWKDLASRPMGPNFVDDKGVNKLKLIQSKAGSLKYFTQDNENGLEQASLAKDVQREASQITPACGTVREERKEESRTMSIRPEQSWEEIYRRVLDELSKDNEKDNQEVKEATEQIEHTRTELNRAIGELNRTWENKLREYMEDLKQMQAELHTDLCKRQESLYLRERPVPEESKAGTKTDDDTGRESVIELNNVHDKTVETIIQRELEEKWSAVLKEHITGLQEIQTGLYGKLRGWRESLYLRELKPLAACYAELYRLIVKSNLHKNDGGPKAAHKELERLYGNLFSFWKKLEKALKVLGMTAFFPQSDEEFNEIDHDPHEDMDEPEGMVVKECVMPGVKHCINGEEDTILPAVVKLKER